MSKLFLSHSSKDDAFVRDLRTSLSEHGQDVWIDSRELRGSDPLWTEIQKAIDEASAYAIVISPDSLQSKWVGKELKYALQVREQRGKDNFPVIPLSLNDTRLGILEDEFGEEPIYISIKSDAGGIEATITAILVALKKQLPVDMPETMQPVAQPLEELVLELTDLKFFEQDNIRRASARAKLIYVPATPGQPAVHSDHTWRFVAPIGPIEAGELRWYLEKYAVWPSHYFRSRAQKVEEDLIKWGKLLYENSMPLEHTANVLQAWARINGHAGRRFSVYVDTTTEAGMPDEHVTLVREAATLLHSLPWEILHDKHSYLFQGGKPTRVRRTQPNTRSFDVPVVEPPIRILLVTARPEDNACGYIDHRISAAPLVEAMQALPGLVKIHVLAHPTLAALREELDIAQKEKRPYHVVHFDGHGIYNKSVGLGGLCFEHPDDMHKLTGRRHVTIYTNELGPILHQHRIPLVFLEACQTAQAEQASESVASELLKLGVASVVAMSHSVLVETAARFVEAFYKALAEGKRVGDAMLAGQRKLKDDTFRSRIFGAGELRLEDWFVPVLFQEKDDPQLFKAIHTQQTREAAEARFRTRCGELPPPPSTGFIGRSRDMLALQRLLQTDKYAVVRGQGGEGKTTIATEFARWMVRSQQVHRAVFVSVEIHSTIHAVIDAIGKQLVGEKYSVAQYQDSDLALQPIEQILAEYSTLLVIDNMESILLPPFMAEETPEALTEDAKQELDEILKICNRLQQKGKTRIVFTSREKLPKPFDGERNLLELYQLNKEDAIKLVERALNAANNGAGATDDATKEEIEQLVTAVNYHARTLALLAPELRKNGVEATRLSLMHLMEEMERKFPDSREKSLFASVALSLLRLSEANRERANALSVFHGGFNIIVLQYMMQWDDSITEHFAQDLVDTGLATYVSNNFFLINPALSPYLKTQIDATKYDSLIKLWVACMFEYLIALEQEQDKQVFIVSMVLMELPNLFALLSQVQLLHKPEIAIYITSGLFDMLRNTGKHQALKKLNEIRDNAEKLLGQSWSHSHFSAQAHHIKENIDNGRLREALVSAELLLKKVTTAGEDAYDGANEDIASAYYHLGRALFVTGKSSQSYKSYHEALHRYKALYEEDKNTNILNTIATCLTDIGTCLRNIGKLDEAIEHHKQAIDIGTQLNNNHIVAVNKGQLGTVYLVQGDFDSAEKAYQEAINYFTQSGDLIMAAVGWHQLGMVYKKMNRLEIAEEAYRESLNLSIKINYLRGETDSLVELGNLYGYYLGRIEESIIFHRHALEKYVDMGDIAGEVIARINISSGLQKLGKLDEARLEIMHSIEAGKLIENVIDPGKSWAMLSVIEKELGNVEAAEQARQNSIDLYLEYRKNGGEPLGKAAKLIQKMYYHILDGKSQELKEALLQQPQTTDQKDLWETLLAIIDGSRDRKLAHNQNFEYLEVVELLLLIEILEADETTNTQAGT